MSYEPTVVGGILPSGVGMHENIVQPIDSDVKEWTVVVVVKSVNTRPPNAHHLSKRMTSEIDSAGKVSRGTVAWQCSEWNIPN